MRVISLTTALILGMLQISLAGGSSTVLELDKVTSIKVEDKKIIIRGEGVMRKRVMSNDEHKDSKAFGQPTQMLYARAKDGVFEIVPWASRKDISGVPAGFPDKLPPEGKAKIQALWEQTTNTAKQIKVGDAVTIVYQQDKMTISGVHVTHLVGVGSLRIDKKVAKD